MTMTWQLDRARAEDWLPAMADGSVDIILTDPPYSEHVHEKSRRGGMSPHPKATVSDISRSRDLGFGAMTPDLMAFCAAQFARLCRRWCLVFCDLELVGAWRAALVDAGLEAVRVGLWVKLGSTPQFTGDRPASGAEAIVIAHRKGRKRWNGGGSHAVWSYPIVLNRGGRTPRKHTTQKPLPLLRELVRLFSEEGETICDPFAGYATTGVAALLGGRHFLGCEIDPVYVADGRDRLAGTQPEGPLAVPLFGLETA
jgi:DNA modification methylase